MEPVSLHCRQILYHLSHQGSLLYYGCATFMYARPKASYSPHRDRALALVYTHVTPLLYPLIYSLRNHEIAAAIRQVLGRWRPRQASGQEGLSV